MVEAWLGFLDRNGPVASEALKCISAPNRTPIVHNGTNFSYINPFKTWFGRRWQIFLIIPTRWAQFARVRLMCLLQDNIPVTFNPEWLCALIQGIACPFNVTRLSSCAAVCLLVIWSHSLLSALKSMPQVTAQSWAESKWRVWRDHCFPEPFSWFLQEPGLQYLKITSPRCFFIEISKERLEKVERTPTVLWCPWALAYSRDQPYNFSCLSVVSKNAVLQFFSRLWVSFGEDKPFVTSNASF